MWYLYQSMRDSRYEPLVIVHAHSEGADRHRSHLVSIEATQSVRGCNCVDYDEVDSIDQLHFPHLEVQ